MDKTLFSLAFTRDEALSLVRLLDTAQKAAGVDATRPIAKILDKIDAEEARINAEAAK